MAIDKDKIPQPLSDAELESMIRGLREIGVSAKEIEKIMEGVNKENQKLIKNLEHVESVQKRITDLNIKDNDIVQQVNTVLEERIEKEGKISKFTEDRVKNLEFINNTDNEGLSIAEKRVKIQDRSKQVDIQINQARNERGQFNKGFNQDIEKGLKIDKQVLDAEDKKLHLQLAQTDAVQEQADHMMSGLKSVISYIQGLPGGGMFINAMGFGPDNMKQIQSNLSEIISGSKDWSDLFKGTEKTSGALKARLLAGAAAIGVAVGLFKVFSKLLKMSSEVTDEMGASFGVMGAQSKDLKVAFDGALPGAIRLGKTTKDLTSVVGELTDNFGMSMTESAGVMDNVLNTSVAMGLTNEEGSKLFGMLMQNKGMSVDMAKSSLDFAYNLARANDVNPQAVMKDMAASMETVANFGGENLENLAEAAVKAKKYGMSLDEVGKIGESLLDFGNSLSNEIEAQMILGKQLNFQKARELALNNDLSGMMDEITGQLGDQFDWNQMNFIERKSLAKVLGVEVSTMERLVKEQQGLITPAKTFAELMGEDAMSNLTKLMNQFKSIGAELMKKVAPSLEIMLAKLDAWVQGGGWQKILNFVQSIANTLLWMIENKEVVGTILGALIGFSMGGPWGALIGGVGGGMLMAGIPDATAPIPTPTTSADADGGDGIRLAKGGKFITSGPTNVLVGDNPGGKELVTALPLNSSGLSMPLTAGTNGGGNQIDTTAIGNSVSNGLVEANKKTEEKLDKLINIMDTAFGFGGTIARDIGKHAGRNVGRKMGR